VVDSHIIVARTTTEDSPLLEKDKLDSTVFLSKYSTTAIHEVYANLFNIDGYAISLRS